MSDPVIGQRFGRLAISGPPVSRNGRYWPCKCECGAELMSSITRLNERLVSKTGCLACSRVKHGHGSSSDPTYSKYQAMKQRCLNPKHKAYPDYGGRGIKVCERWLESFSNFFADMGVSPEGMSIERDNIDGDYEPGNCRWATAQEQAENTRRNVKVNIDGVEYKTLKAAAEGHGLPYGTVRARVASLKWTLERALRTPIDTSKRKSSHH